MISYCCTGTCRLSILLTLFVPALGWVAFNIAGGLFGQLEKMKDRQVGPESRSLRVKRSVAGAMGLGAAGLLASAQTAEASELMQVAAGDNRWGTGCTASFLPCAIAPALLAGPHLAELQLMGHLTLPSYLPPPCSQARHPADPVCARPCLGWLQHRWWPLQPAGQDEREASTS
jgi:hypothetical protein